MINGLHVYSTLLVYRPLKALNTTCQHTLIHTLIQWWLIRSYTVLFMFVMLTHPHTVSVSSTCRLEEREIKPLTFWLGGAIYLLSHSHSIRLGKYNQCLYMLHSALYRHNQNTKWGNIFKKNAVHTSSRVPHIWIYDKQHWLDVSISQF